MLTSILCAYNNNCSTGTYKRIFSLIGMTFYSMHRIQLLLSLISPFSVLLAHPSCHIHPSISILHHHSSLIIPSHPSQPFSTLLNLSLPFSTLSPQPSTILNLKNKFCKIFTKQINISRRFRENLMGISQNYFEKIYNFTFAKFH